MLRTLFLNFYHMVHHGNIDGGIAGTFDVSPSCIVSGTRAIRKGVLSALPMIPDGAPTPLGDVTPECILAMSLYGERSPGLPGDVHPAIYQHCA